MDLNDQSWGVWLVPSARLGSAVVASALVGVALRHLARRHVRTLRDAHWTERARVLFSINVALRQFRVACLVVAGTSALVVVPNIDPVLALRFAGAWTVLLLTLGEPWALSLGTDGTAGDPPAVSWSAALRFNALLRPALWLTPACAAFLPRDYDASGLAWAAVSLLLFVLAGSGCFARVAAKLGQLQPAPAALRAHLSEVSKATAGITPPVYVVQYQRPNAMAFPLQGWVVFTSAALAHLSEPELEAVFAHEVGHLQEPWLVKLSRLGVGCALLVPLLLVPVFPDEPLTGLIVGTMIAFVALVVFRSVSHRMEHRADAAGHEHAKPDVYARALERLYRLNGAPAVMPRSTHPHLYDRMERAGVTPDYPRPRPPSRKLTWGAFLLGCGVGMLVVVGLPLQGGSQDSEPDPSVPRAASEAR